MPIDIKKTAGGKVHNNPVIGPSHFRRTLRVTPSDFTSAEVDANGYLKPGVPLQGSGELVDDTDQVIKGVVLEAVKIAASNSATDLSAAPAVDVAVLCIGTVNRKLIEDNLGRTLTANELSAFEAAGCRIELIA